MADKKKISKAKVETLRAKTKQKTESKKPITK